MMTKVNYFEKIPACAGEREIMARLGYNPHLTVLNELHRDKLAEGIQLGSALCNLRGAYRRVGISEHGANYTVIENRQVFHSANLAKLLRGSTELVLLAATVGAKIGDVIRHEVTAGDAARGVILDAVASETADTGLDWLMQLLNQLLSKTGLKMTQRRYSPGYGDLTLPYQRLIYEILELQRLQLTLTDEYILIPEKSVLAIAGIEAAQRSL
jgi:hypothetical protein